jgi:hypothetical protein
VILERVGHPRHRALASYRGPPAPAPSWPTQCPANAVRIRLLQVASRHPVSATTAQQRGLSPLSTPRRFVHTQQRSTATVASQPDSGERHGASGQGMRPHQTLSPTVHTQEVTHRPRKEVTEEPGKAPTGLRTREHGKCGIKRWFIWNVLSEHGNGAWNRRCCRFSPRGEPARSWPQCRRAQGCRAPCRQRCGQGTSGTSWFDASSSRSSSLSRSPACRRTASFHAAMSPTENRCRVSSVTT